MVNEVIHCRTELTAEYIIDHSSSITDAKYPRPLPIQPEEREILQDRERLTVSQWAVQRRKLSSKTTHYHGPWSHAMTPYLIEIMDSLSDRFVSQVTVVACTQSGKTEVGLNFLGWIVDVEPGPTLVVMPREDDAIRRVNARIRPMFRATPSLLRKIGGDVEVVNAGKESDLGEMLLYLGWAGSPAALADNPCRYIMLDEVGKYQAKTGNEADSVSLSIDRTSTFGLSAKIFVDSSPVLSGDLIDREYQAGDRRKLWIRCVHCGQRHVPIWENVYLVKDDKGQLLEPKAYEAGDAAWYICPHCQKRWTEGQRWRAVSCGVWAPQGCTVTGDGEIEGEVPATRHRSYQISALMLYPGWMTVGKLAAEWAKAQLAKKAGDIGPLQNFLNSRLAQPFSEREEVTEAELLRQRIGQYPPGIVPYGCQRLTAGLDVQKDQVYLRVLGWGYLSEVWSVYEMPIETGDTDRIENWDVVRDQLCMRFPVAWSADRVMRITKSAVDCGYHTDTVIDWVRNVQGLLDIVAVRGDDSVTKAVYRRSPVAGGTMYRYDLRVDALKDRLFRLYYLSQTPGPGYGHLHAETEDDVIDQLTAEEAVIVRKGTHSFRTWQLKQGRRRNHYWDCDVYAAFAAELAGYRALPPPADFEKEVEAEARAAKPTPPKRKKTIRTRY